MKKDFFRVFIYGRKLRKVKKSTSNDSQRISFAINYSTTTCCGCPYYRNSMDGVYCGKAEETGAYKGMIIKSSADASRKIADKCPFKKQN